MRLLRNISRFGSLAIIEKSIAFIFIPLLTNQYGLEKMGEYFLYISTLSILGILGKFGQDAFVTVNVQKLSDTDFLEYYEQSKAYVFKRSLIVAVFTCLLGGLFNFEVVEYFTLGLATVGTAMLQLELNRCHGSNQVNKFFARTMIVSVVKYGVPLISVWFIHYEFYWIYLCFAVAPWVALIKFKVIRLRVNLLRLSTPAINGKNSINALLQQFSNIGLNSAVKYIVGWKLSTVALGGYGAVESFCVIIGVFVDAVYKSWIPVYFEALKEDKDLSKMQLIIIIVVVVFAVVFAFFSVDLLELFYKESNEIDSSLVYLFALYYVLNFIYRLGSAWYYYNEDIAPVSHSVVLGAIFSLTLLLLLINSLGVYAVIASLVFGQMVMITYLKSRKFE